MAGRTQQPVGQRSAFWDTSALVPLCVQQSKTAQARILFKIYEVVVWWATPVEIASALAGLVRLNQLSRADWATARNLAGRLAGSWSEIQPTEAVRNNALQLVEQYDLRAADALQLGAALVWCDDVPSGQVFLTADDRLFEAAMLRGFNAKRL